MVNRPLHKDRSAFTLVEIVVCAAGLGVLIGISAQAAAWSLGERLRNADRQAALEFADNLLESARATSWEDLTPEWAARQKLPEKLVPDAKLRVRLETEKNQPRIKRIIVTLEGPVPPVELSGWFGRRSAEEPKP